MKYPHLHRVSHPVSGDTPVCWKWEAAHRCAHQSLVESVSTPPCFQSNGDDLCSSRCMCTRDRQAHPSSSVEQGLSMVGRLCCSVTSKCLVPSLRASVTTGFWWNFPSAVLILIVTSCREETSSTLSHLKLHDVTPVLSTVGVLPGHLPFKHLFTETLFKMVIMAEGGGL